LAVASGPAFTLPSCGTQRGRRDEFGNQSGRQPNKSEISGPGLLAGRQAKACATSATNLARSAPQLMPVPARLSEHPTGTHVVVRRAEPGFAQKAQRNALKHKTTASQEEP